MPFDGDTYDRTQDKDRLWTQLEAIRDLSLTDERWYTLSQIKGILKHGYRLTATEASISARLRDLRKAKFGSFQVDRRRAGALFSYRVLPPPINDQMEMELTPSNPPLPPQGSTRPKSTGSQPVPVSDNGRLR